MATYSYSFVDTTDGKVNPEVLRQQIQTAGGNVASYFLYINTYSSIIDIFYSSSLSVGEKTSLDGIISAHKGATQLPQVNLNTTGVYDSIANINIAPVATGTINLTLPPSTDTLVGRATTDTLTNKTLLAPVISTISNIGILTLPTGGTLATLTGTEVFANKTILNNSNSYSAGTASQSGLTVTGSGTTFTSAMLGGVIIFANNTKAFITSFTSTTVLSVSPSQTVSGQSYTLYYGGVQYTPHSGLSNSANFSTPALMPSVDWKSVPANPTTGAILYSRLRAGRRMLSQVEVAGASYAFQPFIATHKFGLWTANGGNNTITLINFGNQITSAGGGGGGVATARYQQQ